ncbi:serine hydrolase [Leptolyngbya sp. FACHB-711]|uniref:serine hydrolase n=1 Tax=unclassified Leptolyngbya TaxID=2650499 RepID=UPI00168938A1|nr:serine hydrolase [Leptolyngbya sp. FACHB-711]MBD1852363.1 serine hydrolase [Cyanobacteria bacterium FACHB-502]MBD2025641.1 serine hydrolase [Leptolyngbya sp. FACHB-711]
MTQPVLSNAEITAILQQRIEQEKRGVGIVVGVIDQNGKRIISWGSLDQTQSCPVDENTLFEIGSISKAFTALVLMNMAERGDLKLDDPISVFLPKSVKTPTRNGREISLLNLATHTSGLPRLPDNLAPQDNRDPYADYTVENLYSFLSSYDLPQDIGSQYEYSNLGTGLLGHILSLEAGMDYETLVKTQIAQPLQMNDTCIHISPEQQTRFTTGHNALGEPVSYWNMPTLAGAGALRSTANDLLKFLAVNLQITPSPLTPILQKTHEVQAQTGISGIAIAIGWHVLNDNGTEIIFHDGGTGGFRSFLGFVKPKGLGVVVLSNSENDVNDIGLHLLNQRIPLTKSSPPQQRQAISLDPALFNAYVGQYQIEPGFLLTITNEQDQFYAQATGQQKFELFAETEIQFFPREFDALITFVRDEQGRVTHLVLHQGGQEIAAQKLD